MNTRLLFAGIAFCVGTSATILLNSFIIMMVGEINRKRPEENLVSYFGWGPPKTLSVFSEYRTMYPNGNLRRYALTAGGFALVAWLVLVFCLIVLA